MEIQYILFGLAWLTAIGIYIWFVVWVVRDVRATTWLREAETARAVWTLVVIVWVLYGPLSWLVYRNWRERAGYRRPLLTQHLSSRHRT